MSKHKCRRGISLYRYIYCGDEEYEDENEKADSVQEEAGCAATINYSFVSWVPFNLPCIGSKSGCLDSLYSLHPPESQWTIFSYYLLSTVLVSLFPYLRHSENSVRLYRVIKGSLVLYNYVFFITTELRTGDGEKKNKEKDQRLSLLKKTLYWFAEIHELRK